LQRGQLCALRQLSLIGSREQLVNWFHAHDGPLKTYKHN